MHPDGFSVVNDMWLTLYFTMHGLHCTFHFLPQTCNNILLQCIHAWYNLYTVYCNTVRTLQNCMHQHLLCYTSNDQSLYSHCKCIQSMSLHTILHTIVLINVYTAPQDSTTWHSAGHISALAASLTYIISVSVSWMDTGRLVLMRL